MAPKRKSIDPTPSHVRFRDDKAHKDFSENFSRCVIHLECKVVLLYFSDIDLAQALLKVRDSLTW